MFTVEMDRRTLIKWTGKCLVGLGAGVVLRASLWEALARLAPDVGLAGELRPRPTRAPRPTCLPEATAVPLVQERPNVPEPLSPWPETPQEAAALFGGSPDRWEKNPAGGWHFEEAPYCTSIDPQGYLMEGYWDTEPGRDPFCVASAGVKVEIQGGTIWPVPGTKETAEELQAKMAIPVWSDGKQHPCQVILPDCPR